MTAHWPAICSPRASRTLRRLSWWRSRRTATRPGRPGPSPTGWSPSSLPGAFRQTPTWTPPGRREWEPSVMGEPGARRRGAKLVPDPVLAALRPVLPRVPPGKHVIHVLFGSDLAATNRSGQVDPGQDDPRWVRVFAHLTNR